MTAAHCADGVFHHEVVIGAHEIRDPSNKIIDAYSPTVHPEWDSYNLANDLAILELEEEIDFTTEPNVGTNCLASSGDFSGQMSLVSGWGRPSDSSSGISEVLRYVDDRRVLTQEECENYWGNLNEGVVCIDTTDGGGSCNVSHLLFIFLREIHRTCTMLVTKNKQSVLESVQVYWICCSVETLEKIAKSISR